MQITETFLNNPVVLCYVATRALRWYCGGRSLMNHVVQCDPYDPIASKAIPGDQA